MESSIIKKRLEYVTFDDNDNIVIVDTKEAKIHNLALKIRNAQTVVDGADILEKALKNYKDLI